ncbi:MAG: efflux RND transporter periplasmic adaptor subunit [Saprospiraceae bacterium]|nr:efflux RND transporter periplasmic adaptor subunit [Saprospiraceae bacterium]
MRPLILILLVIAGLAGWKYYANKSDDAPVQPRSRTARGAIAVEVYIASEEASENVINATGTIVANEQVDLQSETTGRLIELNISEGSYVRKDDVIARIDARDLLAQRKKVKFEQDLAQQIEARQKKLLDIDAISKEEYDISVNRVNTLDIDLELLDVQIAKTVVRAPFNGYIGFKNVSLGAYLTPNIVIATLLQTNPAKIDFSIPEKYAAKVTPGTQVSFSIDGQDKQFQATIRALDPKIDEDLRTLRLRAYAQNTGRALLPGMFARVEVPLGAEQSIMVPTQAIIPILKGKKVFVKRAGKVKGVEVLTGVRTDEKVQIREGLALGDSVIVSALMSLREGTSVQTKSVVNSGI